MPRYGSHGRWTMNSWTLSGARVALGPQKAAALDLEVREGRIASLTPRKPRRHCAASLDLDGCLILPGLINAHDHLEFSIFPRLGHGPYRDSAAWARDIYHPDRSPVRELLQVPLSTRLAWGAVSNLLSGVTTVCHHNRYYAAEFRGDFPVRVPRAYGWAHSLEFSPDLVSRFKRTPVSRPFILHAGEAVDGRGKEEIYRLDAMGVLASRTVLVHGVALGQQEVRLVQERAASLVWCPSSNAFILGQTLKAGVLKNDIRIALGTDSALSRQGCLLDELRLARRTLRVPISRLYRMVTHEAAEVMRLRLGEGDLSHGAVADILAVRDRGRSPATTLLGLRPDDIALVMVGGKVKLCSAGLIDQLPGGVRRSMHGTMAYERMPQRVFVAADLPRLRREVEGAWHCLSPTMKAILGAS